MISDHWMINTIFHVDVRLLMQEGNTLFPGLIDGFGTINNQAYADAYLDAGVSSIIGVISARRGELFFDSDPGPEIFLLGEVGEYPQTDEEIRTDFMESKKEGCRVMLLMYKLTPSQVKLSLELADSLEWQQLVSLALHRTRKPYHLV